MQERSYKMRMCAWSSSGCSSDLPPVAAQLGAAEGRADIGRPVGVDPDHARLYLARHPVGTTQVVGPDARSEPVVAVVRDLERLRLVVEGNDAKHRAEDLLPCDRQCRSEEHTSELQSLMRISYAVFCLKKKSKNHKK